MDGNWHIATLNEFFPLKPVEKDQSRLTEKECVNLRALCLKIADAEQERDNYGGSTNVIGRANRLYAYITKGE